MKKVILFILFFIITNCIYAKKILILSPGHAKLCVNIIAKFKANISKEHSIHNIDTSIITSKSDILKEINKFNPDIFFTLTSKNALIANEFNIPNVFTFVTMPINDGLIDNKLIPLKKSTGIILNISPKIKAKLLNKIFGSTKKAGIIYNPTNTNFIVNYLSSYTSLYLYEMPVSSKLEVASTLNSYKNKFDYILSVIDPVVYNSSTIQNILRFSLLNKIPFIGTSKFLTKSGALMSFNCDYPALGKQAARMVTDILNEKDLFSLPVEFPEIYNYSVNLNTAKIFKIKIPKDIRKKANTVYE